MHACKLTQASISILQFMYPLFHILPSNKDQQVNWHGCQMFCHRCY